MEGSATASLASVEDGPESWEVADVDASMRRLMLSSRKDSNISSHKQDETVEDSGPASGLNTGSDMSDNLINTVDQFLREAIQNPRERLSGEFSLSNFMLPVHCLFSVFSFLN